MPHKCELCGGPCHCPDYTPEDGCMSCGCDSPGWNCMYCGHPVAQRSECPMPDCVEKRAAARRRMGMAN